MASTEIIIRTNQSFKTPELNSAVKSFDKFFSGINKNWRDACILMHRLADGKKYEADGFKSIAEFAETIGIEKSTAHKMADAGMVYDSKVPAIAQFADKAGYTKAAKVASIVKDGKAEDLAKAIEDGDISADDTVSELTSWKATKAAQAKGEKVLPKFEVWGVYGDGDCFHYDSIELENVSEIDHAVKVGSFDMDIEDGIAPQKWTVYADKTSGNMLRLRYEKAPKASKLKASKPKMSLDDMSPADFKAWAEAHGMKITFTDVTEG